MNQQERWLCVVCTHDAPFRLFGNVRRPVCDPREEGVHKNCGEVFARQQVQAQIQLRAWIEQHSGVAA